MKKTHVNISVALLALTLLITSVLAGCSSKKADYAMDARNYATEESMDIMQVEEEAPAADMASVEVGGGGETLPAATTRKLITNYSVTLETKDFEKAITTVETITNNAGGYIESSYQEGRSIASDYSPKYAHFTLRIPSKDSKSVMDLFAEEFNVVATSQDVTDITDSYYDVKARLDSLVKQKERLEELLDGGGDLEYLLQVEREIANVEYQIQSVYSQLQNMDSSVEYSTIQVSLQEVLDYGEAKTLDESFGTRLKRQVSSIWAATLRGLQSLVIIIVALLPLLIIIGLIVGVIIFISRKIGGRKKKKVVDEQLPLPFSQAEPPYIDDNKKENKDK